jgi:hypothetical protein
MNWSKATPRNPSAAHAHWAKRAIEGRLVGRLRLFLSQIQECIEAFHPSHHFDPTVRFGMPE